MQIKTTTSHHLTLVRMPIIKETRDNKFWQGQQREPWTSLTVMGTGAAALENSMGVPQKLKIELPLIQQFQFWVYVQRKQDQSLKKTSVLSC